MAQRTDLHSKLCTLLGSNNVYFQPPESLKIKYPCIVYELASGETRFANDMPYTFERQYTVTYIDKNPDSDLIDKLAMSFPKITFNRFFTSDNLNHYAYKLYF